MEWTEKPNLCSDDVAAYHSSAFLIEPLTAKMLFARGIASEDTFWKYAYPTISDLHDPFLLRDMKKAVIRIVRAIKNHERIVIYGDYDVDGITSASLLYKGLCFFGADVSAVLPTRKDGYGLTAIAIERMVLIDPALIITVDNGSNAYEALRYAASKGIDVIVTDHHEITGSHPNCHAFVNPKRDDNDYPNPYLAGAGVAYKLVHALFVASGNHEWRIHAWQYIELAALGTIADLMQLTGENRVIAKLGIQKMNADPSPRLRELFRLLNLNSIDSSTISFLIAPIFNSCGRIGDPNEALHALISDDTKTKEFERFIEQNKKRKRLTQECFQLLDQSIISQGLHRQKVIVACGDYSEGIIGILAARVTDKYHKPAIIITNEGKGSGRSVQNTQFSIINTVARCADLLKAYGGHQAAAGLTVDLACLNQFRTSLQNAAAHEPPIIPIKYYDSSFQLSDCTNALFENFMLMEPFGMGNQKPVFLTTGMAEAFERFGNQKQHAKYRIGSKSALLFGRAEYIHSNSCSQFRFLYSPNSYEKRDFVINDIQSI
ncbi:single-stranded-DNA-specific exonuclease RecJ [Paenibacillus abyssi]|uniref:Single-stranded-DNA-specific exonuclease RecJ n=1 Tax=Paenibacillus abyssi TaxID=1340531 RepID=A0A917FTN3_9BACL|nr:single-stranded-DNA-specific exonuclease RecJ [Paenibacillus abyssi]GGG07658.1 hypothetical protein GCM10010916_25670 [Paenibacillus abyssi]